MVKARRTHKSEKLFELKKNFIDSLAVQKRMAQSLGNKAEVEALFPEIVLVCKDLDEITPEEELSGALKSQCNYRRNIRSPEPVTLFFNLTFINHFTITR